MIPTPEQWASLTEDVLLEVRKFLAEGIPFLEGDEPPATGHPVGWLLQRARTFSEWDRPHRMPTHPTDDMLRAMSQSEVRKAMDTYAKRVTRASVPHDKQSKADWRNFLIRTTNTLNETIRRGEVQFLCPPLLNPLFAFPGGFTCVQISETGYRTWES